MKHDYITKLGASLVRKSGTRDPFVIAKDLGIEVLFCDQFQKLKGMYRVIQRNRFIFINDHLSEQMKRIVCAHEIGHDRLHRHLATGGMLCEFMLYQMDSRPEYEANLVAAEILLPTDELLEYIKTGRYDTERIAKMMETDINLVALKIAHLNSLGNTDLAYEPDFLLKE